MKRYRIGTKVNINVYDGDSPVCQCHTREQAAEIVAAVNFYREMRTGVVERCIATFRMHPPEKAITLLAQEFSL